MKFCEFVCPFVIFLTSGFVGINPEQLSNCGLRDDVTGVCVPSDQCQFVIEREVFNFDVRIDDETENLNCGQYGKNLVCCENFQSIEIELNSTTSNTISSENNRENINKNSKTVEGSGLESENNQKAFNGYFYKRPPVPWYPNPKMHPNMEILKNVKCGRSGINRIANGENTELFEFPWAAILIYEGNSFGCSGSLISESLVLTAAHCLVRLDLVKRKLTKVRLGEWDTSSEVDCIDDDDEDEKECADPVQDIAVKSFVAHPGFKLPHLQHDIGLIHLMHPANLKANKVTPICLPFTSEFPKKFTVIGWGATSEKQRSSAVLQKAVVPLFDQEECRKKFDSLNSSKIDVKLVDGQFCAGGEGKVDSCRGDSGSLAQFSGDFHGKPKIVQFGIVSFGVRKCNELGGFPGIYTKVSEYLNWILDHAE